MQRLYYLLTFHVIGTHSLSLLSNSSQNSWCFVSRLSGNQCELTQENACSALRGGRPPACAKRKRLKLAAQWRYNISTSSSEIHQKTLDICCLLLPRAMTPSSKGSRLSFSREFLQFSIQCGPGWSLIPAGNNVKGFLCTALQVAFLGPGNPMPFDAWYNNVIRWSPDHKATLCIILSQHHERWKTTVTGGHWWPIHMNKSIIICTNYSRYLSLWLDPQSEPRITNGHGSPGRHYADAALTSWRSESFCIV